MDEPKKYFKAICPECNRPFTFPCKLENPEGEGEGDVAIECMYCRKSIMITLPGECREKDYTYKEDEYTDEEDE